MTREEFTEVIRKQYAEKINSAYLECEHQAGHIDYPRLRQSLIALLKNARVEGLSQKEFHDLIESTLPEDVRNGLDTFKAAA